MLELAIVEYVERLISSGLTAPIVILIMSLLLLPYLRR